MSEKSRCPSCLGNKKVLGIGNFHKRDCALCSGTGFIEKPLSKEDYPITSGLAQQKPEYITAIYIDPHIKNPPITEKSTEETVSNDAFIINAEDAKKHYHPKEGNKHGKSPKGSKGKA